MFLKDRIKAKTEFRPASDVNYSFLQIDELDWGNNKVLYKSRPSQPTIVDFLINQHVHISRNAPMDINEIKEHQFASIETQEKQWTSMDDN